MSEPSAEWEWAPVIARYRAPYDPGPLPPYVTVVPGDFAHGVWTALAATLAEPLRQAFEQHWAWHHCPDGIAYCEEGSALFRLLPEGEKVIFA